MDDDMKFEMDRDESSFVVERTKIKGPNPYLIETTVNNVVIFKHSYMDGYSLSVFQREVGRIVTGYYDKKIVYKDP